MGEVYSTRSNQFDKKCGWYALAETNGMVQVMG